ncbi:MAG: HD domain-containing protein [Pirellulales bacterium]
MIATAAAPVIDTIILDEETLRRRAAAAEREAQSLREELAQRLFTLFDIYDATNRRRLAGNAGSDEMLAEHTDAFARIAAMQRPEVLERNGKSLLLGLPLGTHNQSSWVAIGEASGIEEQVLLSLAEMFVEMHDSRTRAADLHEESRRLSEHIAATFEEITLIYRLTQNLSISRGSHDLGAQALQWLADVVPTDGTLICLNAAINEDTFRQEERRESVFLTHGEQLLSLDEFIELVDGLRALNELDTARPVVLNQGLPGAARSPFPQVRNLVLVPLREGERLFGWLAAINHRDGREFGSSEANLLASVGTILGIHSGNIDLYKQQADLFGGVVRAMSSAIDAKDPYTRGHSDRVARVAVRIAEELGCDDTTVRTLYLGGLLHDVGKIGINDDVLRKPGKLTDGEYEHIKTHVEIGYRILRGLKKMGHLLPIVLHHHESWDGKGYPFGLAGTNIPFLARIVAVADAYDAMASDRPYRKGMEDEKLDAIFRSGSGKQWDPDIVDAFFRARDDIRMISQRHPDPVDTVSLEWAH